MMNKTFIFLAMAKSISNGTIDKCIKCGKVITYDKPDGYWDSLEKKGGKYVYTPYCDQESNHLHEPINYKSDEKGYYHPSVGKKKIKV